MSKNFYKLYCEPCNWKKISDGSDLGDLHEIKESPVPGGIPYYDRQAKKIIEKASQKKQKKYRCPNCGRVVIPRKITNPQEKIDQQNSETLARLQREEWDTIEEEARRRYERMRQEYEQQQSELNRD